MFVNNKIVFISPRRGIPVSKEGVPLQKMRTNFNISGSVILSALKSAGYETHFIDAAADGLSNIEYINSNILAFGLNPKLIVEKICEIEPKYILITSMFTTDQFFVDELVNYIKDKISDCLVILGGIHASVKPEWHFDFCNPDFIVLGEGEETIVKLIKALDSKSNDLKHINGLCFKSSDGHIIKTDNPGVPEHLNQGFVIKELLYRKDGSCRYYDELSTKCPIYEAPNNKTDIIPSIAIYPSRGCPYNCDYCTSASRNGTLIRHVGCEKLKEYFKVARSIFNVGVFYNQSDTFGIHKDDWCFLYFLAKYRKESGDTSFVFNNPNAFFLNSFFLYKNDSVYINESRLDILKEAGFNVVTIAIETFAQRFNKKISWDKIKTSHLIELFQEIRKRGIKIDLYMVYGFPDQTIEEFTNDCNIIDGLLPYFDWINWHFCTLFPGSGYYMKLFKQGRINEKRYREEISNGYSFFKPIPEFNFSKIPNNMLLDNISKYGNAWR